MDNVKKTKLNQDQITRLINVLDINKPIRSAYVCEVKGTAIKKVAINYENGDKESFYPDNEELEIIVNGITLTRNK
jgi:hypothetical protein